jgi:hypothetical protein
MPSRPDPSVATPHVRVRSLASLCTLAMSLMAASCNFNKTMADTTSGMLKVGSVAVDRESDLEFARYAFPASLKTLETFLVNSPENEELLLLLARGFNSYAFAIVEGDLELAQIDGKDEEIDELTRRAKIHYLRGSAYGFKLLDKPALEKAARAGDLKALDAELAKLKKKDAPGLFWAGYGWASAVNLAKDDAEMLTGLGAIEHIMAHVVKLDAGYNAGAPLVFQGVFAASRPVAFGGKPAVAKQWFERAMAEHGEDNLLVPYLYARFYCPQVQDQKLFDALIAKVLEADPTRAPDLRLNNEVARARARFWKAHADDLILPEG